jgi:hypothetical protein
VATENKPNNLYKYFNESRAKEGLPPLEKRDLKLETVIKLAALTNVKTEGLIVVKQSDIDKKNEIVDRFKHFNPDEHVIVTKQQLDITKQLQALTGIAAMVSNIDNKINKIDNIEKVLPDVAKQVNELHNNKFTPIEKLVEAKDIDAKLEASILSKKPRKTCKG